MNIHVSELTVGLKVSSITSFNMSPLAQHLALYFSCLPSLSCFSRSCHVDRMHDSLLSVPTSEGCTPLLSDFFLLPVSDISELHSFFMASIQPSLFSEAIAFLTVGFCPDRTFALYPMNTSYLSFAIDLLCCIISKSIDSSFNTTFKHFNNFWLSKPCTPLIHTRLAFLHARLGFCRSFLGTS